MEEHIIEELLSYLSHIGFELDEKEELMVRGILKPTPTLQKVRLNEVTCGCIHCMRLD